MTAALCLSIGALAAGCGGPAKASKPVASHSASPSPTGTPLVGDPLTGAPVVGPAPVVAIKVDNVVSAQPLQRGLAQAAVVYQELIEGGATRLMAIYEGPVNVQVGPNRSARPSDLQILAAYGRVVFGFSGANSTVLKMVDAANVVPRPEAFYGGAYVTEGRRPEAYNFFTTPAKLVALAAGAGATAPHDVGFRFGPLPPGAGTPSTGGSAAFSNYAADNWSWDASRGGWVLKQGPQLVGTAAGAPVAPQNIIVQYVAITRDANADVLGNHTFDSATVGSGRVSVYRDGRRIDGTWRRPTAADPTHYLDPAGRDIVLRPGATWVLLVPRDGPLANP